MSADNGRSRFHAPTILAALAMVAAGLGSGIAMVAPILFYLGR